MNVDLIQPRIKVIAPMPLMKNDVGSLLQPLIDGSEYSFGIKTINSQHFYSLDEFKEWPYIFKILDWWQERKQEEMPEYLKTKSGAIFKVNKNFVGSYKQMAEIGDKETWYQYALATPSNESEHLEYINQKKSHESSKMLHTRT